MDDVTRPRGDGAEGLEATKAAVAALAGELTHLVLGLFRSRGIALGERLTLAGGDPFEVIDVFVVTLRALAEGLESPDPAWLN